MADLTVRVLDPFRPNPGRVRIPIEANPAVPPGESQTPMVGLRLGDKLFEVAGTREGGRNDGWTPLLAVVVDGERRVIQVQDWFGGDGAKPTSGQYVGSTGLVASASAAVDIRGAQGLPGGGTSLTKASNADVDRESDDSDYMTVAKTFRAIARKVKSASTTVRGLVLLARNADVDATETDTSRVLTVASGKRLIARVAPGAGTGMDGAAAPVRIEQLAFNVSTIAGTADAEIPIAAGTVATVEHGSGDPEIITAVSGNDFTIEAGVYLVQVLFEASAPGGTYSFAGRFRRASDDAILFNTIEQHNRPTSAGYDGSSVFALFALTAATTMNLFLDRGGRNASYRNVRMQVIPL